MNYKRGFIQKHFPEKSGAGFTLIELLVVISIVSFLATLAVTSLNNARIKARDAKRLADMNTVRKAMELFYDENSKYDGPTCPPNFPMDYRISTCSLSPYLETSDVVDPSRDASETLSLTTFCHGANTEPCNYAFWRLPVGQHYMIFFYLEGATDLGNTGPINCIASEEKTECGVDVSYNFCSNRSAPPATDPIIWKYCGMFDFNQDGNITVADYAAHDL